MGLNEGRDTLTLTVSNTGDRPVLVAIGGRRVVRGLNGLTEGALDDPDVRGEAFRRARELGFLEEGR